LLEVLIAVMVLGVAFVAILGGMGTSIISSELHRRQAIAETAIRRYAEAAKRVDCSPSCPTSPSSYTPASVGFSPVPGFSADPATVVCLDSSNAVAACPASGVVRVTVSLTSTDTRVDAALEVIKRPG
jgi:type II secretory pathway pseudopilin PulG